MALQCWREPLKPREPVEPSELLELLEPRIATTPARRRRSNAREKSRARSRDSLSDLQKMQTNKTTATPMATGHLLDFETGVWRRAGNCCLMSLSSPCATQLDTKTAIEWSRNLSKRERQSVTCLTIAAC